VIRQAGLEPFLRTAPVIPVLSINNLADAVPLARALAAGGLRVIEVTLRTEAALAAIEAIATSVPEVVVGVGTLLDAGHLAEAAGAGARFAVSPGATPSILDAAEQQEVPLLPGIATPSEAMAVIERGYRFAKFFPAEPSGGAAFLAAIAAPLPQLMFCPTGGVTLESAPRYLGLSNVICVGGSWMVKPEMLRARDWAAITQAATAACRLRR
jgi:2-dehydro-3-deoxyphosphogluconate aldolase / (4S)-4-hydroxy-2-oxoglutarate aldolase